MPTAPRRFRLSALITTDQGALGLLVLLFFGMTWPLLTGQVSERWDGEDMFAPYYRYVAALARSGHFLWWNPFSNGGSPDFAEPQYGAFSPVTLLAGLLTGPGPDGYHFYWLGLWLCGGLGMYVLARALSAPPWGALVASLSFVLGGYYIGHAEHTSLVYTYSFVPWVLWRLRAALVTGQLRPACEAGALWGLSAMAGNPAVHIPAGMFIGLVGLAWLPVRPPGASPWAAWRTYFVTMGLLFVVGVLVLAPTYQSFRYEVAGYSHRTQPLPRSAVLDQKLGFGWLTALFTPVFVPFYDALPAWADYDVSQRLIYCGATLPILAAFAVWRDRHRWRTWAMLGTGLLFLGIAMGKTLPLRTWLYDLLPVSRFFRHAPMFGGFFVVAVAMLGASGSAALEKFRREGRTADRQFRPLAIIAGVASVVAVASYVGINRILTGELAAQIPLAAPWHLASVWLGLTAVCTAAAHWTGFRRFLPGALVVLTALDLCVAYGFTGHVAYRHKPAAVADGPIQPLTDLGASGFNRTIAVQHNSNLYTREPMFVSYTAMRNYFQENWGLDRLLRRGVIGSQRVWFAAGVPTSPATSEAYAAFQQHAHAINALPVLRQTRASLLQPGTGLTAAELAAINTAPAAERLDFQVLAYHANDLSLQVACPKDGFLLVTDRWSRSWEATVNGRPVPVEGGDFLFRLLPVKAGKNLVRMQYRLAWFYPLLILSWSTLALVGTCALWTLRRPRLAAGVIPVRQEPVLPDIAPVAVAV